LHEAALGAPGRVQLLGVGAEPARALAALSPSEERLRWAAPEHAAAATLDARVDIYGLGLILLALLTGAPPPLGARSGGAGRVGAIVGRCLSPAPADRWASADALAQALGSRWQARIDADARGGLTRALDETGGNMAATIQRVN
jgi:hypothetical protein